MRIIALLAAALVAPCALAPVAHACGACFQAPDAVSSVTDHRMVIAIADRQTTLWDQIQYDGNPADFVWVLPTPSPADVQLADAAFFDTLEAQSAPRLVGPSTGAGDGGGGCLFAASDATAGPAGEEVTVYHQGVVGPYQTATVGSDDPDALARWLTDHGYAVPDGVKPILASYTAKKWVFNVLRLRGSASVQQMRPVRVIFPGLAAVFPLRMVAAGAASDVGITLWVIADQRYGADNYDTVEIDESRLRWSAAKNRSNYRELFTETLAAHRRGAFVTEFAGPLPLYAFARREDLDVALVGQPERPTLTRLRTRLAPSLLAEDLVLAPAPTNAQLSNFHYLMAAQIAAAPSRGPLSAGLLLLSLLSLRLRPRRR